MGRWYWEIHVSSTRFTKFGYSMERDEVFGHVLKITKPGSFGMAINLSDNESDRFVRIFYPSGEEISLKIEPGKLFIPCVQIEALQQVTFNFGEPQLKDIAEVRNLFSKDRVKGTYDFIARIKANIPQLKYILPQTYRQQYTLPIKKKNSIWKSYKKIHYRNDLPPKKKILSQISIQIQVQLRGYQKKRKDL